MKAISIIKNVRTLLSHEPAPAQRQSAPRRSSLWERGRRALFWTHLAAGLIAGLFILVMSATGIILAFEPELFDYLDRDAQLLSPAQGASRLSVDALLAGAPDASSLRVPADPSEAYVLSPRGGAPRYLDPFTGETRAMPSDEAHEAIHVVEDLHRFLALEGDARPLGKLIHGSANLAFVFLCLSGLVLWFPRKWTTKKLRRFFVLVRTKSAQARDFNLHSVFGFWSLIPLVIITASALPISFVWAHELIFEAMGEQAPAERGFRMMMLPPQPIAPPPAGTEPLPLEEIYQRVAAAYPEHESISLRFGSGEDEALRPIDVHVATPAPFSARGLVMVQVDPYDGRILSSVGFDERSPALRARLWTRFLHTGEAFGFAGRLGAALASFAALVLTVTGGLMSYRRFRRWRA